MGFGGGSSYTPPPAPPPQKVQARKPVTEAAVAARQSQRDKAAKAAGIRGSIHTAALASEDPRGQALLGR